MAVFEVVFHGQARPGVTLEQARMRIGQLFQASDKQLDVLFSGRRVVIKQGLDEAAAEKYRQAIERAGALCVIEPVGGADKRSAEPVPAPKPSTADSEEPDASPSAPSAASPSPQPAAANPPRDEFMAAFRDVQAPDLPVAPLGADMQTTYADHTPLDLDLSAFTLAPPGSDLEQLRPSPPAALPDISHLQLADEASY